MRALTWTPIISALVILLTSPFLTTRAQIRTDRRVTAAQIKEAVKRWYIKEERQRNDLREPRTPDERARQLLDCVRRECGQVRRALVTKEILLRLQIRDMDQDCTSSDGNYTFVLYEGPFDGFSEFGNDVLNPTGPYQAWQDKLLDTGLTFCNPFKHLYCSPNSKKCECRPGTAWKPEVNKDVCSASLGGTCWLPGVSTDKTPRLYDTFNGKKYEIGGAICSEKDKECTTKNTLKLFLNNFCANDVIREVDQKLEDQFKDSPRLNFKDSCNFDHQTQLFTTTEEEVKNYKIRVMKLEAILAAKPSFCDHSKLLVCGSGGKCECMKPMIYNNETCRFTNPHEGCQEESTFNKMATKYPGRVSQEILNGYKVARDRECSFRCDSIRFPRENPVEIKYCSCQNPLFIGKNCDIDLTKFLDASPPPSLPIDIPDYDKQLELFAEFNEKAKEFEKLFRLEKNSPCAYEGELEAHRSIRRIKNVEFPDKIFTTEDYKDLMSSMDNLIAQFNDTGLCKYGLRGVKEFNQPTNRAILLCGPRRSNSSCFETNNTVYLKELMKRLSRKSIQATNTGQNCIPEVSEVLDYARREFRIFIESQDFVPEGYEYIFNTLENHWIQKDPYCNRTAGFKCSKSLYDKTNATGKCEFSRDVLDDALAELEQAETDRLAALNLQAAGSSLHLIQHFLSTIVTLLHVIIINLN